MTAPLSITEIPVLNYSERREGSKITAVVIHHTGEYSLSSILNTFNNPSFQASAHYLIDRRGRVFRLVNEQKKAWHAGRSALDRIPDVNQFSIGIELQGDGNLKPYPDAQLESAAFLVAEICLRYSVPVGRIVGHQDVAPGRKVDPGKYFDFVAYRAAVQRHIDDLRAA